MFLQHARLQVNERNRSLPPSVFTVNKIPSTSSSATILVSPVVVDDVVAVVVAADAETDGERDVAIVVIIVDGLAAAEIVVVERVAFVDVGVPKIDLGCRGVLVNTTGDVASSVRATFAAGSVKQSPLRFSVPSSLRRSQRKHARTSKKKKVTHDRPTQANGKNRNLVSVSVMVPISASFGTSSSSSGTPKFVSLKASFSSGSSYRRDRPRGRSARFNGPFAFAWPPRSCCRSS